MKRSISNVELQTSIRQFLFTELSNGMLDEIQFFASYLKHML